MFQEGRKKRKGTGLEKLREERKKGDVIILAL